MKDAIEAHHFKNCRHAPNRSRDSQASASFAELVVRGQDGLETRAVDVFQSSAIEHDLKVAALDGVIEALFKRPSRVRIQVTLESQNESISLFRFVDMHWGVSTGPALSTRRP